MVTVPGHGEAGAVSLDRPGGAGPPRHGAGGLERRALLVTLRALAQPRRLVPIVVLAIPLVAAQAVFSSEPRAVGLAILMCVAFVVVAPAAWRMFAAHRRTSRAARAAAVAAYGATGVTFVAVLGVGMPALLHLPSTFLTLDTSLAIELALFWVGGWGLGRDIELERDIAAAQQRAEKLARQAEHASVLAVRAHLDPHFLFNTLNAIAETCREDGEAAERAILDLAALLRRVLPALQAETWPLAEELALVEQLWSLHRMRDPTRMTVSSDWPADVSEIGVPPMLLLPLAENAVTHGPAAGHSGHVSLRVRRQDPIVCIEIRNPGRCKSTRRGGQGLALVTQRLRLTYGDDAELSLSDDGNSTLAVLQLPQRSSP